MASLASIRHLLPNEHLLNFYAGTPTLPDWLGSSLNLILGAGDLDQGDTLNVEKFNMFDVFFCQPWDSEGSLRKNVEYLLKHYPKQKVICFIDNDNKEQVDRFCSLFKGRFALVDGYGGHTPHLPIECVEMILQPGGKAVNLYELNEGLFFEHELTSVLMKNPAVSHKNFTPFDVSILLGKTHFYTYNSEEIKQEILETYETTLLQLIGKKRKLNKSIDIDWSVLPMAMEPADKLRVLKTILAVLIMFDPLPATLKGVFQYNRRIWNTDHQLRELVVTKVQEGGKRKRRQHKTRKTKRGVRK